ncbi:acyltransferase [Hamadaea sp. NPDC051192]|uniref:acyltransferase family protein n=1 Tax=Hamadaea sp. NPDC051192 TaxID=3154940 RepID=UPI003422B26D
MSAAGWRIGGVRTLADRFSSRANSIGFLRHLLAFDVLVAHTWPLAFGAPSLGTTLTHKQTDLGTLSVYGFFILSGFLITASGRKFGIGRFSWHRFLRIFPGLWVCLLVTAFAIAPVAALIEGRSLGSYLHHSRGPWEYVTANWFASMSQYPISGLLSGTPYGHGKPSAFDGSLWSLKYELLCYVLVGILAVTAVLRRARPLVSLLAVAGFVVIVFETVSPDVLDLGTLGPLPLLGSFSVGQLVTLGTLFLFGAVAQLFPNRVPLHPALAVVAGVLLAIGLFVDGFPVIGLPAYAYLLLYAVVALPAKLHAVGRKRDYSYGVYIYAFPVQQMLALVGGAALGAAGFIVVSSAGSFALAALSWHLVERPAMALKDLRIGRRRTPEAPPQAEPGTPPAADAESVLPSQRASSESQRWSEVPTLPLTAVPERVVAGPGVPGGDAHDPRTPPLG